MYVILENVGCKSLAMNRNSFQDISNNYGTVKTSGMSIYGSNFQPSATSYQNDPNVSGMTLLQNGGSGTVDITNYKYIAITFHSDWAAYVHCSFSCTT